MHAARRTVAGLLDEQGLTARPIADELCHARVLMTQDVYMGRWLPRPDVARSLDTLFDHDATQHVNPTSRGPTFP